MYNRGENENFCPKSCYLRPSRNLFIRGGVEDTRLEAKAKGTKKIRGQGQGQPFRGQTLSGPRAGMLEAKAKDQGHSRKCSPKKKVFKKVFQAIPNLEAWPEFFVGRGAQTADHMQ